MTSFAAELSALLQSMPGLGTDVDERAAWFERKAKLLERTGAEGGDPALAAELAANARQRAAALRGGRSS
jgi:hypothetical protein